MTFAAIFAAVAADSAPSAPVNRDTRAAAALNNLRDALATADLRIPEARAAEIARVCHA